MPTPVVAMDLEEADIVQLAPLPDTHGITDAQQGKVSVHRRVPRSLCRQLGFTGAQFQCEFLLKIPPNSDTGYLVAVQNHTVRSPYTGGSFLDDSWTTW